MPSMGKGQVQYLVVVLLQCLHLHTWDAVIQTLELSVPGHSRWVGGGVTQRKRGFTIQDTEAFTTYNISMSRKIKLFEIIIHVIMHDIALIAT